MSLRDLPSVDNLLAQAGDLVTVYGRPLTTEMIRETLDGIRAQYNGQAVIPSPAEIVSQARARLAALTAPTLRPVVNASGVILHTNLGRAPMSLSAIAHMEAVARGYSTLEYDLDQGARGAGG